jgi:hypothetical protein
MTTSNASFMSMDLPEGHMDDFFATSMNATRVFSYAEIVVPSTFHGHKSPPEADTTSTKASISELSAARTETELSHKRDLERITIAHQQANAIANATIEAQRLEIEQYKAQRLKEIESRTQDTQVAQLLAQAQADATMQLRQESDQTKLEINALRNDMKSMMRQFLLALPSAPKTPSKENKRATHDENDDNSHSEKRRDVRSTPGKKLYYDEMDLRDSPQYASAMEEDATQHSK